MNDRYSISQAADHLGVSPSRWEACGKLVPEPTVGGQRPYSASLLMTKQSPQAQRKTVGFQSYQKEKDL
ncbi:MULTISPECIES: hypothetical protein [unclassified Endozoicomonas]